MNINDYVKKARQKSGLTLQEAADKCGNKISKSQIWMVEQGKTKTPSAACIMGLSIAFDTDYMEMLVIAGYVPRKLKPETKGKTKA